MTDAAPSSPGAARPPSLRRLLREGMDIPLLMVSPLRRAARTAQPPGRGQGVLVLPGFLADDRSTSFLRRSLDAAGFRSYAWGMGQNRGFRDGLEADLDRLLERTAEAAGGPVTLLGWSLGGIYAREMAKRMPDQVRLVATMGTPFSGSLRANNAWRLYERVSGHAVDSAPPAIAAAIKPPVPTIAMWSRRDGVVAPLCSEGLGHESDERIELPVTHMGFAASTAGVNAVARILAERL